MEEKILVDTNIFIDALRLHAPAKLFFSQQEKSIAVSLITQMELLAGQENNDSRKRSSLLDALHRFETLPITTAISIRAGDIIRQYHVEIPDALLAATAIENKLMLFTRNLKDFAKIKELKIKKPY